MFRRILETTLRQRLQESPAVVLLGPRQVGKTTLALDLARDRAALYLDLESERDRAKLAEPELYLADHADELVILDEVQRVPELFRSLRGLIDRGRREGRRTGRFLLLGSASLDLLRQSSESLAGRVAHLELGPLDVLEVGADRMDDLWVRGGFPESFLAPSAAASLQWRLDFIRTYLERDVPQLGSRIPAETLRRVFTMLAHTQGGLSNLSEMGRGLGVDSKTCGRYVDLMVDLLLVRRLAPWHANVGKRLVKSPRFYIRDSGIVHALLGLPDKESVLGHPVAGASWEGLVVETLAGRLPPGGQVHFYRTAAGAEIDLLLVLPGDRLWAVEVKRTAAPKVGRGLHQACLDLMPERRFLVYSGDERFPLGDGITAIGLPALAAELTAAVVAGF
jgi:predicted AAA+ superfamily ATPase